MPAARIRGYLLCEHVPRRGPREYMPLASGFPILTRPAPFLDLTLGTGIEAGWVVGPPLC